MKDTAVEWLLVKILNWLINRFEDFIGDFQKYGGI
jgi:hypothetical protein